MSNLEEIAQAYADAWKADIDANFPHANSVPSWDEMGAQQRAAMIRVTSVVVAKCFEVTLPEYDERRKWKWFDDDTIRYWFIIAIGAIGGFVLGRVS